MNVVPMKMYVGTKVIKAAPMTRIEYNNYRGWELPEDEELLRHEKGMLVEYEDTGHPNHKNHAGYISWSPMPVFKDAYKESGNFTFGVAIMLMKLGFRVQRAGWNGKGMFCIYVPGTENVMFTAGSPYANAMVGLEGAEESGEILPHFDMYTINAEGRRAFLPGWLATQSDMDAEDWSIV